MSIPDAPPDDWPNWPKPDRATRDDHERCALDALRHEMHAADDADDRIYAASVILDHVRGVRELDA